MKRYEQVQQLLATGLSQAQVAERLGVSHQYVSQHRSADAVAQQNAKTCLWIQARNGGPKNACSVCGGIGHNRRTCPDAP